eukprot:2067085-Rhodomonas_salina.1
MAYAYPPTDTLVWPTHILLLTRGYGATRDQAPSLLLLLLLFLCLRVASHGDRLEERGVHVPSAEILKYWAPRFCSTETAVWPYQAGDREYDRAVLCLQVLARYHATRVLCDFRYCPSRYGTTRVLCDVRYCPSRYGTTRVICDVRASLPCASSLAFTLPPPPPPPPPPPQHQASSSRIRTRGRRAREPPFMRPFVPFYAPVCAVFAPVCAVCGMAAVLGGQSIVSGRSAVMFGGSAAIYGVTAARCRANAAIYGASAAICRGHAAIYDANAAIYGANADNRKGGGGGSRCRAASCVVDPPRYLPSPLLRSVRY